MPARRNIESLGKVVAGAAVYMAAGAVERWMECVDLQTAVACVFVAVYRRADR